ncbi:mitochondrial carrier [Coniochaeta ligniaria NRRL 30616]|uniref:Mitochondrial carrier n=1 Tax=Coniochaeta ligniaria NRRL 30616 TaxID=1408157 RepID=A0A1J7JT87_9PEZI|nr:mitochondrial carrier [Coniochaeta ligniaria NRRL 30616]
MSSPSLLPSLAHALSGSTGTAISTLATYPLDLVNTRLKVQRQLSSSQSYNGILDAFRKIYAAEGGASAFFTGLRTDIAKSAIDSFLFFLFYNWFRAKRLHGRRRHLNAAEELAIGAVAGAAARLFTTPVGNVVTRRQTASLVSGEAARDGDKSFGEVLGEIRREKGVLGLWAGYSASLVLTLNPSITFFLQQTLTKRVLANERWDSEKNVGTGMMFVLAAVSKAVATGVTYPFQIAKARVQVGPGRGRKGDEGEGGSQGENGYRLSEKTERLAKAENVLSDKTEQLAASAQKTSLPKKDNETIFGTVARIRREEGVGALYDGLQGELLKAFFSHGVTMVSKDVVHKLLFRLYFAILAYLNGHPKVLMALLRLKYAVASASDAVSLKKVSEKGGQLWNQRKEAAETARAAATSALSSGKEAAETVKVAAASALNSSGDAVGNVKDAAESAFGSGKAIVSDALENSQRKIFEK